MKKIILLTTVVFALSAAPAFSHCGECGVGEGKGSKGSMSGDWKKSKIETMTASLGLSEEQVGQLEAVLDDKMAKKAAIFEEKKAKMEAVSAEYKEKLSGILTPEQLEKYEAMKAEKGSDKGSRHGHKGSGKEHGGHEHGGKEHGGSEKKGS